VKIFRTKHKTKSSKSEHQEQRSVIDWGWIAANQWPQYSIVIERKINGVCVEAKTLPIVAIPNGGKRDKRGATILRAEGLRRGFPDLIIPVPVGDYIGLAIEMKKRDGVPSDVKPHQRTWLDFMELQGWKSVACFGSDQAIEQITNYLNNVQC